MLTQTIQLFTEKEEEFVNLLVKIGMRKNIAKMLVYLANVKDATSREIERGADLRQPEVSTGIKYLAAQGWIKDRKIPSGKTARPLIQYSLATPVKEIIAGIEKQKKIEAKNQLALIKKMQNYV